MIRPELIEAFRKWGDVLIGLGLCLFGAWWAGTATGTVAFLGYASIALGVVLMIAGWQRMRFQAEGQGPGVVRIVERRLAYLGPLTGGAIEMDDVERLELVKEAIPAHWVLHAHTGEMLEIPVNAEGAEALFDLFTTLPDLRMESVLSALNSEASGRITIWQADHPPLIS